MNLPYVRVSLMPAFLRNVIKGFQISSKVSIYVIFPNTIHDAISFVHSLMPGRFTFFQLRAISHLARKMHISISTYSFFLDLKVKGYTFKRFILGTRGSSIEVILLITFNFFQKSIISLHSKVQWFLYSRCT